MSLYFYIYIEKEAYSYICENTHIYRSFVQLFVLTQDTFLALGVFSMATCKAEMSNNNPTSMESQMEG